MLAKLADLAARRGVAVVCVSHLNKGAGRSAVYRVTGSLGFVAAARTVWSVSRDEHDHERRLMLPIKNNLARDTDGLAYSLYAAEGAVTPCVAWEDETVAMIADDALGRNGVGYRFGGLLPPGPAWGGWRGGLPGDGGRRALEGAGARRCGVPAVGRRVARDGGGWFSWRGPSGLECG